MPKFEYKVYTITDFQDDTEQPFMLYMLNKFGEKGWELVTIAGQPRDLRLDPTLDWVILERR